jgi:hypothetical protein
MDIRILLIDIETTPHLAWTFDLHNTNISHDKIVKPSQILCFSAMWYGEDEIEFWDLRNPGMLLRLWQLLDEADAVVHYYGERFDVPRIRGELWAAQFLPPAPFKQIDLWKTAKTFGLASSSLAYVSQMVGSRKLKHSGFTLWLRCIADEPDAWAEMERYSRQDVAAMIPVYESMLPWMTSHPSHGANDGTDVCPNCGSDNLSRQGFRTTRTGRYQRFQCGACGAWSASSRREAKTEIVSVAA